MFHVYLSPKTHIVILKDNISLTLLSYSSLKAFFYRPLEYFLIIMCVCVWTHTHTNQTLLSQRKGAKCLHFQELIVYKKHSLYKRNQNTGKMQVT